MTNSPQSQETPLKAVEEKKHEETPDNKKGPKLKENQQERLLASTIPPFKEWEISSPKDFSRRLKELFIPSGLTGKASRFMISPVLRAIPKKSYHREMGPIFHDFLQYYIYAPPSPPSIEELYNCHKKSLPVLLNPKGLQFGILTGRIRIALSKDQEIFSIAKSLGLKVESQRGAVYYISLYRPTNLTKTLSSLEQEFKISNIWPEVISGKSSKK